MYKTCDIETYKKFKEEGLDIILVKKTILDVLLEHGESVAPRGGGKRFYMSSEESKEQIAQALREFDKDIKFTIEKYDKHCYNGYKIIIL